MWIGEMENSTLKMHVSRNIGGGAVRDDFLILD
jgi:hypothetical protein